MIRYRFQFLLAALFAMILALPLLPVLGSWSRYAALFFFALMLLAAVIAVAQKRNTGIVALGLFLIAIVLKIIGIGYQTDPLLVADHTFSALFMGTAILLILRSVFTGGHVTLNTICAALSVYLLLAVLWASLYALVELIEPGSFAYNTAIGGETPSMQFGQDRSVIPIYFSLVTLTTLGYGDITPVSPAASMLAVVEAVVGQFYLTVLVAWLVGMYITDTMKSKAKD
jgi:ion channel